jgi:hypothetical protein
MKRWPLRWKLAIYAAALAVVATIAGAATTWTHSRRRRLRTQAESDGTFGNAGAIPTVLIVIDRRALGGRQALARSKLTSQGPSESTSGSRFRRRQMKSLS